LTAAAWAAQRAEAGPPAWSWLSWGLPEPAAGGEEETGAALGAAVAALLAAPASQLAASAGDPLAVSAISRAGRLAGAAAPPPASPGDGPPALHPRPRLRNPYVEPATETERAVVETWQSLLRIERIGVNDSFFDLGGDSLLGTQVISRVRETWGVDVTLPALFEDPTPAALARRIEAARSAGEAGGESEADRLARVFQQLQDLSAEDVERMLAERGEL
jgi:hypothetical protein